METLRKYEHTYEYARLSESEKVKLGKIDFLTSVLKESCANKVELHVPPHLSLQLAASCLTVEEVEHILVHSVLAACHNKASVGYRMVTGLPQDRVEVRGPNNTFLVYKIRDDLNGRLDLITAGRSGERRRELAKGYTHCDIKNRVAS